MRRFVKPSSLSLRLALGALALCLLIGLAASVSAAGTWEYVGSPGFSTFNISSPALAFDSSGTPYVAFRDADPNPPSSVGKLTVKKFDGANWVTVGSRGFSPTQVSEVTIAIDGTVPYVAYSSAVAPYEANVMKFESGSWTDLNSSGLPGQLTGYLSLVVDAGTPYLAYSDNITPATPYVMKYSGGVWTAVGSGAAPSGSDIVSLAIHNHTPYLAFADGSNSGLATVKKFESGTWSLVGTAGFSPDIPGFLSLVLDSSGTPYVAFQDASNGAKATVMKFNGTSWGLVGSGVVSTGIASYISLDIDSAGKPYVAFQDGDAGSKATVMKFDGTSWSALGGVGFTEDMAQEPSLKLYDDTPHLVFSLLGSPYWGVLMQYDLSPTVTAFAANSVSDSFNIPIPSFTASGNAALTGYLITESATPPLAGAPGWSGTAPTTYTVSALGTYTLYPWAKDSANRVSGVYGSPVTVDVTASAIAVASNADNGAGSLRQAISNVTSGGTITFDNNYTINLNSPLTVDRDLTIDGTTKTVVLDGQNTTRVMEIDPGTNVTLDTLTIRNGNQSGDGGGVLNEGILLVKKSTFTNNQADYSGAIANQPGARLTLDASWFTGNTANISGGAIYNWYGTADITNSTFSGNTANSGGAIFNDTDKTLSITDSTLENNTADDSDGGAIYNLAGTMTLTRTTVQGNTAQDRGGGIKTESPLNITDSTVKDNIAGRGAGIFNLNAPFMLDSSWLTGNSANADGGGIYSEGSGTVEIDDSTLDGNKSGGDGGAVFNDTGSTLNLRTSTLSNNTADNDNDNAGDGGGIYNRGKGNVNTVTMQINAARRGGAVYTQNPVGADFELSNSTLSSNMASLDGGGVFNEIGTFTVSTSTFRQNAASGYGGSIHNDTAATLNALASTFENNQANNDGGAIYNKGIASLTGSAINNNMSSNQGGGISSSGGMRLAATALSGNVARRDGGAIAIQGGSASAIINSTVSGNTAGEDGGEGGGIYTDHAGTLEIANVTLSGNTAPANSGGGISHRNTADPGSILNLKNTIIANSPTGGDCKSTGTVTGKNNLIKDTGANACNLTDGANGNLIGREPRLTPLAANGGPTNTQRLENDSPAIDAGDQFTCDDAAAVNKRDQRGKSRDDLQCDIGGFELTSSDSMTVQLTPQTGQMRTFGPARAGIKSDGTPPGVVTMTRQNFIPSGSVLPFFMSITAPTDTGLNLTLRMCYSAADLGSLAENDLRFWSKKGVGAWTQEPGAPTLSGASPNRCAERAGITHLSEWTLGTAAPTAADDVTARGAVDPKGHAVVRWESMNELQIVGYNVYRKTRGKQGQGGGKAKWKQVNVNLIQAKHLGMAQGAKYRFTDKKVQAGKTYRYKIQVLYADNHITWTNLVRVKTP